VRFFATLFILSSVFLFSCPNPLYPAQQAGSSKTTSAARKKKQVKKILPLSSPEKLEKEAYGQYLSGALKKAAETYQEAASLTEDPRPLLNAAMCYRQLDNYKSADEMLEEALVRDGNNIDIYCELGWLNFHMADYERALGWFAKAYAISPDHARTELGLASVYSNYNMKKETIIHLKKYQDLRPDFSGVDYIVAWNYMNLDMMDEAEKALIRALKKDPDFIEARMPLAGIYTRHGKFNEAYNQYTRILEQVPDHPVALKMKKILTGKLTRQPEDLHETFRVKYSEKLDKIDSARKIGKSDEIRVGLGTNQLGNQWKNKFFRLKSFYGFRIIGKASQKEFAMIPANKSVNIVYGNHSMVIDTGEKKIGPFAGAVLFKPIKLRGTMIFEADRRSNNPWFKYSDREYRGYIELYPVVNGIGAVNVIETELYLLGVVPSEVSPSWPYETLKAQAVIARTQALIRTRGIGRHGASGYHVCDGEHCQAYKGKNSEANSTSQAVHATQGEILMYKGKVAEPYFHACCGGWTQASKEVTGWKDLPYLTTHADGDPSVKQTPPDPWAFHLSITGSPAANCLNKDLVRSSHYRWMKIIKQSDMTERVNKKYRNIGEVTNIVPLKRAPSGNVNALLITGTKGQQIIKLEHLIRNILGYNSAKSTMVEIEIDRRKDGAIRNYWIYGGGWGHGIGLCQSGAAGLAYKYKKDYKEILEFYFPGTDIVKKNSYDLKSAGD